MSIVESAEPDAETVRLAGRTTIELHESDGDAWLATQPGVPVEGRGPTAAAATADYCRRVDALKE